MTPTSLFESESQVESSRRAPPPTPTAPPPTPTPPPCSSSPSHQKSELVGTKEGSFEERRKPLGLSTHSPRLRSAPPAGEPEDAQPGKETTQQGKQERGFISASVTRQRDAFEERSCFFFCFFAFWVLEEVTQQEGFAPLAD